MKNKNGEKDKCFDSFKTKILFIHNFYTLKFLKLLIHYNFQITETVYA